MLVKWLFSLLLGLISISVLAASEKEAPDIEKPLYKPFIERYILDELKALRQDNQQLRAEIAEKIAQAKLESADRAISYTADTTNTIFYIITAAASILVLLGWKSIRDFRFELETVTERKIHSLTQEYEQRLSQMEEKIKERSEQIIANQQKIADTNMVHSLWLRAGLEKAAQEKISIYDQILEINGNDIEALTYKADALLELGEIKWALSLANQAIEQDDQYGLAYWQRACARAELGQPEEAIDDITVALELSDYLYQEILQEGFFESLQGHPRFRALSERTVDS